MVFAVYEILRAHRKPILVYQMSKVGSTSVRDALKAVHLHALHFHFLGKYSPTSRASYLKQGLTLPYHMYVEALIRPYLKLTSHRLKIITLVRDPIARHVSASFQLGQSFGYNTNDAKSMETRLASKELMQPNVLEWSYGWFANEIEEVFGIDVLAHPFDVERGYAEISGERVDVLVLKLEKLNELWPEISRFVGHEVSPARANVRTSSSDGDTYKIVRTSLRLPRQHVEKLYDHRWMRHFYSEQEVAQFIDRWSSPEEAHPAA